MPSSGHRLSTAVLSALVSTGLGMLSVIAAAQDENVLDSLVFDPVLLDGGQPALVTTTLAADRSAVSSGPALPAGDTGDAAPGVAGDTARYVSEIAGLERREGQYAPALVQTLLSLGRLYQARDNHEEAIAAFERADHIHRVNHGLYDPGQLPIIEAQVESHLALGDFAAVDDKQRYLLFLNRKLRDEGSIARVTSLAGLGDYNMQTLELALMETDNPALGPRLRLGGMDKPRAGEIARYHAIDSLYRARSSYSEAISTLIDNRNFRHPNLLELEYKFLETIFLTGYSGELIANPHYYLTSARRTANLPSRWTYLRRNAEGYEAGVQTFERILAYLENDPTAKDREKVMALVEYGDWHLVFGWDEAAAEEYGRAWALAQLLGLEPEAVAALFTPAYPVQLPLFTAKPNSREKFGISREAELDHDGWINMSFLINRNGTARRIRVTGRSDSTTPFIENRLRRYLKNSPFRPYVIDGETVTRRSVNMRYYFAFIE